MEEIGQSVTNSTALYDAVEKAGLCHYVVRDADTCEEVDAYDHLDMALARARDVAKNNKDGAVVYKACAVARLALVAPVEVIR